MVAPELQTYVAEQRTAGVGDAALRHVLLTNGWPVELVDEALQPVVSPRVVERSLRHHRLVIVVAGVIMLLMIIGGVGTFLWLRSRGLAL